MTQKLLMLIGKFTTMMTLKINKKTIQGYHGWDLSINKATMLKKLRRNLKQEDYVDVANLAMFLWNLKEQERKNGND